MTFDLRASLNRFGLEKVRLNLPVVGLEIDLTQDDQDAAWELYVEMLTRIVTQPLPAESGDELAALDSVYSLFPTTREILRTRGRRTIQFSKGRHPGAESGGTALYRQVAPRKPGRSVR